MKQSAVEWLEKAIKDTFYVAESSEMAKRFESIFEQAKQMEAEQSKIPELSDKKIQEHSLVLFHTNSHHRRTWISACKWYREHLKQRQ